MFTLASEESYEDGQIIIKGETSGNWVYVILSGTVEISRMVEDKKFVIERLHEGEIFGELSFLGNIKRTCTVQAIGETRVGIIDKDALDEEFNQLSSDFRAILVSVVNRFKIMIDRAREFSTRTEPRQQKNLSLTFKDRQSFTKAYTVDISRGGLFIRTKNPLNVGERFLLNLQLPGLQEPLKIQCDVAWARKEGEETQGNRPPGMGVKFMEMSDNDSQALKKYLESR